MKTPQVKPESRSNMQPSEQSNQQPAGSEAEAEAAASVQQQSKTETDSRVNQTEVSFVYSESGIAATSQYDSSSIQPKTNGGGALSTHKYAQSPDVSKQFATPATARSVHGNAQPRSKIMFGGAPLD